MINMSQIHHFEVTSRSLYQRVRQFQNQLGFEVFAHRAGHDKASFAVAVYTGSIVAVVQSIELFKEFHDEPGLPTTDWISDVALIMNDSEFDKTIAKIRNNGVKIVRTLGFVNMDDWCSACSANGSPINKSEIKTVAGESDSYSCAFNDGPSVGENASRSSRTPNADYGMVVQSDEAELSLQTEPRSCSAVRLLTVQSPFPGVHHTIMTGECDCLQLENKDSFKPDLPNWFTDTCLSGFSCCPRLIGHPCEQCDRYVYESRIECPLVTHVDHITFACNALTSSAMLKWYSDCLGFSETVFINTAGGKGFVLEGSNGMRLSAMQYWMCSEVCVENRPTAGRPVQLIFAEPLPNAGPNQVQMFLNGNGGPGIQHIAFHTSNITQSVTALTKNGILFVSTPPDYYTLIEKVTEIEKAGEDIALLKENNILIDTESQIMDCHQTRYLLQVFSHCLFDGETFFLELITRCGGAKGFGAGNIAALWKALDIHYDQSCNCR